MTVRVNDEAAPYLGTIRTADNNGVTAREAAVDADHACRQEAAAAAQRCHRPGIDGKNSFRLERAGDPFLPRRDRVSGVIRAF